MRGIRLIATVALSLTVGCAAEFAEELSRARKPEPEVAVSADPAPSAESNTSGGGIESSNSVAVATPTAAPKNYWVFGQMDHYSAQAGGVGQFASGQTLYSPRGVSCNASRSLCYLVDYGNNRVLIFPGIPNGSLAPLGALGQESLTGASPNRALDAPTAATLKTPVDAAVVGNQLWVSDYGNHRLLVWSSLPSQSGVAADLCLGQSNCYSSSANRGGTPSAISFYFPGYIKVVGSKLIVPDSQNNRILIWNTLPTSAATPADVVVGQPDFVSNSANQGGTAAANTLKAPSNVAIGPGGEMVVSDSSNHRVLVFSGVPASPNASAVTAMGQASLTAATAATTQVGMNFPRFVEFNGNALYVVDSSNQRVLHFSALPSPGSHGAAASGVIGQTLFTTNTACASISSGSANCLYNPRTVQFLSGKMFVSDLSMSRVLVWNTAPTSTASADVVLGQPNFNVGSPNQAGSNTTTQKGFYGLNDIHVDDRWLYVPEQGQSRVVIWDKNKPEDGARYVIGQPNFNADSANQGGTPGPQTLSGPISATTFGNQLFVADYNNSRVMVYDLGNLGNNMAASYVIGQPNFNSNSSNQGGSAAANTFAAENGVFAYNGKLYVADTYNHRVLGFDLPIASNNPSATVVYMASSFTATSGLCNRQHVTYPSGLFVDSAGILISSWSSLVLALPLNLAGGEVDATGALGVTDWSCTYAAAATAGSLGGYNGYARFYFGKTFIPDKNQGRVLVYNGRLQDAGPGIQATGVIGKPNATTVGAPTARGYNNNERWNHLYGPTGVTADSEALYIADRFDNRIVKVRATHLNEVISSP